MLTKYRVHYKDGEGYNRKLFETDSMRQLLQYLSETSFADKIEKIEVAEDVQDKDTI